MTFASAIHDPLAINLAHQKGLLLSLIPQNTQCYDDLQNATTKGQILTTLSTLLSLPSLTKSIATLFRPILMDLCARWLESTSDAEQHLVALCYLVQTHEELFPILNQLLKNFYPDGFLSAIPAILTSNPTNIVQLHQLILAYYRLLQANRELPRHLGWSLAPLSKIIWASNFDSGLRLLSIRCYALQSGMGEEERCNLEREILGETCGIECPFHYGQDPNGLDVRVDGWILPVVELKRIQQEREDIITNTAEYFLQEGFDGSLRLESCDLCPLIVNIHGILLLRSSPKSLTDSPLIPLPSTIESLRQLGLHISSRLPTILTSSPSAGKALLLSHLSKSLHPDRQNQIITIHLADTSLDPRALLGSYVSSTVHPGTFEWKEGVLVRSMREGKWIVFEDIDRGSNEVLGVIKPLVESLSLGKWIGGRAQLVVPGRGMVVAHADFMLFATRSVSPSRNGHFHPPTFFGSHKFSEVIIPSPSDEELHTIINVKYPRLIGPTSRAIIHMWSAIRALGPINPGRDIGLRELQKFCERLEGILPVSGEPMDVSTDNRKIPVLSDLFPHTSLREDIYLEARDVFFGAGSTSPSSRARLQAISHVVGECLGFDEDRQQWVIRGKGFDLELEKDVNGRISAVRLGRTRLPALPSKQDLAQPSPRPFAMHKPALSLLTRIGKAISHNEPVLLTGETGTGKTSAISHLASLLRRPLISLNLSHQTESSDLIGGLKPIDARIPGSILQEKFLGLFGSTFSRRKNEKFEKEVRKSVNECKWKRAVGLWKESVRLAMERIQARNVEADRSSEMLDNETPRKRRKTESVPAKSSELSWTSFLREVEEFEVQHVHGKGKFAFGFVEGPLIKALKSGDWILLDEVNLASPETLECITGLLHGPTASITLTEHGALEPVPRHPDFRLFACMNPATDVGKKDLPPTIRSRFTEIDVPPPDADKETLLSIISQYIGHIAVGDKRIIMDIAEFYSAVKKVAEKREIADGANHRPHFSMRTLVRALTFAADTASTYSLRRSVWEGCLMAFTMALDGESAKVVTRLAHTHLLSSVPNSRSVLSKSPPTPSNGTYIKFGPFFLEKGPLDDNLAEEYIITPSVEQKLIDLSRIILTRRFPVLIEGPTSSGKTSSIEYLAKRTGHQFVRINNHEHTDIQEYLGSYISDPITGKLVFRDGLLVQALRFGHWIVLDELNLAPTDVLEALNRLLDDNRELVIPETQEVVRPHPHFMLFATQNPPGLYAGRKILSRAFRNRFLEVHFEDVPQAELETILCQRCRIAPSYGKKIVAVFHELQKRRQTSRVFESKQGFATLRDLFRWAGRDAVGYQELAENGYMLLAERARRPEDKVVVKEVIESVMGVRIDEGSMYNLFRSDLDMGAYLGHPVPAKSSVIWTKAMQRLYILVCRGLKFNEPILLVGETGSGKTSVCQVFADASSQRLISLNCHQNTETADIIGGLRPVRNRGMMQTEVLRETSAALHQMGIVDAPSNIDTLNDFLVSTLKNEGLEAQPRLILESARQRISQLNSIFEWRDGPLIETMRSGDVFLLDEISLADDSVLERLNSVLEPGRSIVLAERGGTDTDQADIHASDNFKLLATMNPGGDYGKKELSPALRNRFTEIWVPSVEDRSDLEMIVGSLWACDSHRAYTPLVLDFVEWLCSRVGDRSVMSLRDILAWVVFTNSVYKDTKTQFISANELFHHAAHMTYLDGLSALPQMAAYSPDALDRLRLDALRKLDELSPLGETLGTTIPVFDSERFTQIGAFAIENGSERRSSQSFNFEAPTTRENAMRVVRACQVTKPILLEGSPGVGKTSLITALAKLSGHNLCRINLSDQTDLIDLFGSDLPVEGGSPGEFAWKDAEFLRALQEGHWVLLDEMNLAPQAVLEGLNAVLDHRGTVYIPELNRSFQRHPSFRVFAAQNPLHQGGGRKGLPKSFVNRFSKVYIKELTPTDLYTVCSHIFPDLHEAILHSMISFNLCLNDAATKQRTFAHEGAPWEFNLRDVIRWGTLLSTSTSPGLPQAFLRSVYLHRFRSSSDRSYARALFDKIFSTTTDEFSDAPSWTITTSSVRIGHFHAERKNRATFGRPGRILKMQLSALEALGDCISQSWLAIVTGPKTSGKTEIIRTMSNFCGQLLWEVPVNSATDTMDILGSFEQVDLRRRFLTLIDRLISLVDHGLRSITGSKSLPAYQIQATDFRSSCERCPDQHLHRLLEEVSSWLSRLIESHSPLLVDFQEVHASISRLSSKSGQFEWVDGPLVKAMKSGNWILLDGANLCGPSVLDRLNSLCESNGTLTLSEQGFVDGKVQVITPHPNFRLFMTVDPHYGELSRAMRNRGLEIALLSKPVADDTSILYDHYRLPRNLATVTISPNFQSIFFDAFRRGIVDRGLENVPHQVASTGRILDQDSALSYLVDQAPALVFSSTPVDDNLYPWFFFLTRALVPAYMPQLVRYASHQDPPCATEFIHFIEVFPQQDITNALQAYRNAFSTHKRVSAVFVNAQPMDFYWGEKAEQPVEGGALSPRWLIFEILNLSAALFAYDQDRPIASDAWPQMEKHNRALQSAINLTTEVYNLSHQVLKEASTMTPNIASVQLATKILGFNFYIKAALSSSSYDFSALYAISNWVLEALEGSPTLFEGLSRIAKAFHAVISFSKGQGLLPIWSNFYVNEPSRPLQDNVKLIDELASSLKTPLNAVALRAQSFSIMSLETIPLSLQPGKSSNMDSLNKCLLTNSTGEPLVPFHIDQRSLLLELYAIASSTAGGDQRILSDTMHGISDLACEDLKSSLSRIVPYQHLIWSLEVGKMLPGLVVRSQLQLWEGLWDVQPQISGIIGPSILLHPITIRNAITTCDMDQVSLLSLSRHADVVRQQARLTLLASRQSTGRVVQTIQVFFQTLVLIATCFSSSYDPSTLDAIRQISVKNEADFLNSFSQMVSHLQLSSDAAFVACIQQDLVPLIHHVPKLPLLQNLGLAWVGASRLLTNLCVPDTPVDPAVVQNANNRRLQREEINIKTQIHLHQQLEALITGNEHNDVTQHLTSCVEEIRLRLAEMPLLPARTDVTRLHLFWSEVTQFQTSVMSPSKIDALLNDLVHGAEDAHLREQVIQESLAGFYQRLDSAYPDFVDISNLLKLSVQYMRLGLRFITESKAFDNQVHEDWARSLLSFPSACSSRQVIQNFDRVGPSSEGASQNTLIALSALCLQSSLGIRKSTYLPRLEQAYEQILGLWRIDRAKEKKIAEDANSLYRKSKVDQMVATDAELEEEEFLALFPNFEDAFEGEAPRQPDKLDSSRFSSLVQPTDMENLLQIHYEIMESTSSLSQGQTSLIFRKLTTIAIRNTIVNYSTSLSDSLDRVGLPFQLSHLQDNLEALDIDRNPETTSYNFYLDPNYRELKKGSSVILALRRRLEVISEEWPDQMVVKHLMERCDDILRISSRTSIAKLLSMVEQLLVQSQDWEMYSNRDNTIKMHQDELVRLVVDWRRLELSCWKTLLDSQAKSFTEDLSSWWFRLYDALILGALNAFNEDPDNAEQSVERYVNTLIPLLDSFITSSPLGQFHPRMRLLHSFEFYISMLLPLKSPLERSVLQRILRILNSTFAYYNLFADQLQKRLTEEKTPLESEVKAFIKLASWKDVNVQALKQSAQKTHRQLYKIMKKFRDALRQPISTLLGANFTTDPEVNSLTMDKAVNPVISLPETSKVRPLEYRSEQRPEHLVNLDITLRKFHSLVEDRLRPFIQTHSAQVVDEMAIEIITTSKELASITIPTNLTSDLREKHKKALLVRKRKAFADLLKQLKHTGLASNVKPEILRNNCSEQWIREQPIMTAPSSLDIDLMKGEDYFFKLRGSLPSLRDSLSTHHPDLTTRELQRAVMFLESAFSIAVDLRARLIQSLIQYQHIESIVCRLQSLNLPSECAIQGRNLFHHVCQTQDQLSIYIHALCELRQNLSTINSLDSSLGFIHDMTQEISALEHQTGSLRASVSSLVASLKDTPLSVLTQDETDLIQEANIHLSQISNTVSKWHQDHPRLDYLLSPLKQWLSQQTVDPLCDTTSFAEINETEIDQLISSLLLAVQAFVARAPSGQEDTMDDDLEKCIINGYQFSRDCTHLLNLDKIGAQLDAVLTGISSQDGIHRILNDILPFLARYLSLAKEQIVAHSNWTKAVFKLNFVLCSVFLTLSQQGFCQPQESDNTDSGGEVSNVPGVGIGEGSGTDNVSKEIEDESQIEGLKGEEEGQQQEGDHEDGDAIEMNDDFGGKLEDVPDDGSEDEANADDGSEADFDETLGDLDDQEDAVDEKLWGDEKGPEDSGNSDEKTDEDHSKQETGSSEVVAKESKEKKESKDKKGKGEEQQPEADVDMEEEEQRPEDAEDDEMKDADANGGKMDDYVQDANTLELPDEMDLGEDGAGDEELDGGVEDDEAAQDDEQGPLDDDMAYDQDESGANEGDAPQPDGLNENEQDDNEGQGEGNVADEEAAQAEDEEEQNEDNENQEIVGRPDTTMGAAIPDPAEASNPQTGEETSSGETGTSKGGMGQKSLMNEEKTANDDGSVEAPLPSENLPEENNGTGSATSGVQQGQSASQNEAKPVSNPLRSLGDTLKEIQQRFDEILDAQPTDVSKKKLGESNTQSQVEYLLPDDPDHDMQALAPAGDEQVAKLDQLKIVDEDMEVDDAPVSMDVDAPLAPERHEQPNRQSLVEDQEATAMDHRDDIEGAILKSGVRTADVELGPHDHSLPKADKVEDDDKLAEMQLRQWRAADYPDDQAEKIWRTYESLTHDLAYTLCEQLRLILEPTMATRLKGDYRTGKRLNMKKVISYIASDYTKDKIWLRRTKPSQREYQVLISIDDSRSMAESHSVHLAYQTLALISKALSRLESGDVAIAKFGETFDLLHGFDEGTFSDQAGTKVMNAFRFSQKATDVLSLLETSLKVLETARERKAMSSASAADLWQLHLIISDGMCQDHEKLRTVLRKAEEQRVMIVFIVLDTLQAQATEPGSSKGANHGSILSIEMAQYKNVDGKFELQLQKYLDSFPFEYYVILREVEALPDVLAGTLKQFFERISEE